MIRNVLFTAAVVLLLSTANAAPSQEGEKTKYMYISLLRGDVHKKVVLH